MNSKLISKFCHDLAILSVVAGTIIGLTAVWVDAFQGSDILAKGLTTTGILFVAAALGAIVTITMTPEE